MFKELTVAMEEFSMLRVRKLGVLLALNAAKTVTFCNVNVSNAVELMVTSVNNGALNTVSSVNATSIKERVAKLENDGEVIFVIGAFKSNVFSTGVSNCTAVSFGALVMLMFVVALSLIFSVCRLVMMLSVKLETLLPSSVKVCKLARFSPVNLLRVGELMMVRLARLGIPLKS